MSPSRRSVSVTRDEAPVAAESLASYDSSLLSSVTELQQQLQQKDADLQQLSEALLLLQSSPSAASATAAPSSTSALVKDLMRQKRDLHLQLTRERQQHSQQLVDLRASLLNEVAPHVECGECEKLRDEAGGLQGRLSGAKAAVREWQKKCERLENALLRECGSADEVNEATKPASEEKVEAGVGGWKGRAERVKELERKVSALQARLREQQAAVSAQNGRQSLTSVDAGAERRRDEEEKRRAREAEERDRQLSELREGRKQQAARVKTLELEVGEMKQRLLTMIRKSEMDDTVIDRLKEERRDREEAKGRDELRWQQKDRGLQDRLAQLESQLAGWQQRWQQGEQWQSAILSLSSSADEGERREWTVERDSLQSMVVQLQQRCDELTADKLNAQRSNDAEAKRAAKARLSQPKGKQAAGGAAVGGLGEEERRRMVDMAGERELIRETYAAMLERREEELEQWKAMREKEREEEQKTREALKAQVVALIQSVQQSTQQ